MIGAGKKLRKSKAIRLGFVLEIAFSRGEQISLGNIAHAQFVGRNSRNEYRKSKRVVLKNAPISTSAKDL